MSEIPTDSKLYLEIFREDNLERYYKFLWTIENYKILDFDVEYVCNWICIEEEHHCLHIKRSINKETKPSDRSNRYKVELFIRIFPDWYRTQFKLKHRQDANNTYEELPCSSPNGRLEIIFEIRLPRENGVFPDLFLPLLEDEQTSKVYKHMQELFSSELYTDLVISVGEEIFKVHKAVLANRSRVFARMLEANMKEKDDNKIVIKDCESEVFGEFLRYMYSNKLNLSKVRSAVEMYKLSDKYDLTDLKYDSSVFLARNLSADNVIELHKFAELYEDLKLKKDTLDYMSLNLSEVIKSPDWPDFASSTNDVNNLLSIIAKFVSEDKIYEDFRPISECDISG